MPACQKLKPQRDIGLSKCSHLKKLMLDLSSCNVTLINEHFGKDVIKGNKMVHRVL